MSENDRPDGLLSRKILERRRPASAETRRSGAFQGQIGWRKKAQTCHPERPDGSDNAFMRRICQPALALQSAGIGSAVGFPKPHPWRRSPQIRRCRSLSVGRFQTVIREKFQDRAPRHEPISERKTEFRFQGTEYAGPAISRPRVCFQPASTLASSGLWPWTSMVMPGIMGSIAMFVKPAASINPAT